MSFFDKTNPLGLPKGSIRSILALFITCISFYIFIKTGTFPSDLLGINGFVLGYYFTKRDNDETKDKPE